jgi:small-conductance mechanosensitive channel
MFEELSRLTAGAPDRVEQVAGALAATAIIVALALVAHAVVFRMLRRIARASDSESDNILIERLARPARYAFVALGIVLVARETPLLDGLWQKVAGFVMPALLGWIALAITQSLIEAMELRHDVTSVDNLRARRARTRLAIFGRIASFIIVFVTVGLMLLSIPGVRDIGVTLMASAGLAGLAVGAAAQPALKSLIGGLQMALTEPIAIDDVVIIDGEWGRVEDIRTTYVVVRTWDERRLVVPITRFLEAPFQNWTRDSANLLAPVILHLDPLAEITPIRGEFVRQVNAHELWDGRICVLQVTEASVDAIEVRLLMSAKDAPTAFDLRCAIRESMLAWIRENQPEAIVRRRLVTAEPLELAIGDKGSPADAR